MKNGFEKAGKGFGFTYNKVLFFLRIDNIFYDDLLDILDFKTHSQVDYSDHYPVSAVFSLEKPIRKIKSEIEE
jgi:endonuclease/exonuclease/phosphatase (EEP) superfamily protein YafD